MATSTKRQASGENEQRGASQRNEQGRFESGRSGSQAGQSGQGGQRPQADANRQRQQGGSTPSTTTGGKTRRGMEEEE